MVDDAVDERRGASGVGEDGRPVAEREVRRQHEAALLVAAAHDLEEKVGVARVVREVPDLVEAEEWTRGVVAEPAVEGARGFLAAEVEEHLRGGDEQRAVAGEQRSVRDVLGDHRLAQALRRDENDVARAGEEVEVHRGLDGVAVDALGPVPVEVGERLETAELGTPDAALEALLGASALLGLCDVLEELGRVPPPLGGERDEVVELGRGMCEADGLERLGEGGHDDGPSDGGGSSSTA